MMNLRLILLALVAAIMAGCTGADIHDDTYNTRKILLNDTRDR